MERVRITDGHDFEQWRALGRGLLLRGVRPDQVIWEEGPADLFADDAAQPAVTRRAVGVVPQKFVDLAKVALFHKARDRFALLYRLLFRLQKDTMLLASRSDPDVSRLYTLCGQLWKEKEVERNLPAPAAIPPADTEDDMAEAEEIVSLAAARAAVQGCRRCPLFQHATQAVFGEGPQSAEVMFVGEQPGDQEDLQGKPFVGPAGEMLQKVLDTVGIDRRRVYVTNAVKHFKFEPRGKRRIHQKPNAGEITACRFWINLEREVVRPKLVVALGATAVQSLMGKAAPISSLRGKKLELPDGAALLVTIHPSYLLRMPDREKAKEELRRFEDDLRAVKAFIDRRGEGARHGGPLAA
jgi:uracil-DNA glycosylase family protein